MINDKTRAPENVCVVLKDAKTGRVKHVEETHNLVTTAGLRHYAQQAGVTFAVTPSASGVSFNFVQMTVAASHAGVAVSLGSSFGDLAGIPTGGTQTIDPGYPTTADSDGDNTGSGTNVLSWLQSYTTAQGSTNVKIVVINQTTAATGLSLLGTNLLLMAASLAVSVPKTASDTLKVFVNHTFVNA